MPRQEIRAYDYVNHPYLRVRDTLVADPARIFQAATRAAADRAQAVAGELRVNIAGLDVAAEVVFTIGDITEQATGPRDQPLTRIPLSWEAAKNPRFFPLMDAELSIYPLTGTETQLDFLGRYDPPLGILGEAVDAIVGRRIAEASVHRFVADIARYLRTQIGSR